MKRKDDSLEWHDENELVRKLDVVEAVLNLADTIDDVIDVIMSVPNSDAPYIDIETGILHWHGWKYRRIGDCRSTADTPQTDCETCKYGEDKHRYAHICNECGVGINNYTPQTESTAKCLNCHNAKACKEKHWDGCIYEPQTDYDDIYPLVIIEDRYTGVYSNGKYTAWNMYFEDIPREIDEDDVTCRNFWHSYEEVVGLGDTPNEAVEDLRQKMGRVQI